MIVYLIKNGEDRYKVGYTDRRIDNRLKELQTASPTRLEVVKTYESANATKLEKTLHRVYGNRQMEGEWFELTHEDVAAFEFNCEKIDSNLEYIKKYKI